MSHTSKMVHIDTLRIGDTVVHNGHQVTVGRRDFTIGFDGFAFRGDSYKIGTQLIEKIIFKRFYQGKEI